MAKANAILDEAKRHGDQVYADYLPHEELQQQRRQNVHNTIEELLLQTSTVMADVAVPIKDRIEKTLYLYQEADERAAHSDYDKAKYAKLLFDYARFLHKYGKYQEAENVYLRQIALSEELYGSDNTDTVTSYNNIGLVYNTLGDYPKSLEYYFKALEICEKVLGKEHPSTATSYNNIAWVYRGQENYKLALEYYTKALHICENKLGPDHPDTRDTQRSIAIVQGYLQ